MANLSATDIRIIEDAFGSASGYVMDLTNASFASLFRRDVGIDVYADAYAGLGTSKGKRLRSFLEDASDDTVLKALKALWVYRDNVNWSADWRTEDENRRITERFETMIARLESGNPKSPKLPNTTAWLAKVSRQLRRISVIALEAADELEEKNERTAPAAAKNLLQEHHVTLSGMLPADFPASRIGDMARHIHFSHRDDLREIARFDVPDVMDRAERYAEAYAERDDNEFDVRNLVDEIFRRKLIATISSEDQDYHGLVLQCSVILAERFKARTGMSDEMGSIGKAFSPKDPVLMVPPDLDDESNRNYQQGAMYLFQGYRAFFRNTHAHGVTDTDRDTALQALMLFSLLATLLTSARRADGS